MTSRTQITIEPELQRKAHRRAADQGISFAEYVRRLLRRDLEEPARPKADISAIFGIGDSGGSDIANHKDEYIGEAFEQMRLRRRG